MKTGKEFINQFKDFGITHDHKDSRFQDTLDFQDFVGHMNTQELHAFYKDLDQSEKRTFIWAVTVTLSFDMAIDVIKATTIWAERIKLYEQVETDIAPRENKLAEREITFHDCKRSIWKRIGKLKSELKIKTDRLKYYSDKFTSLSNRVEQLRYENRKLKAKACDFDNVKAALELVLN